MSQFWGNERVFCNPPYGREISLWVQKCYFHALSGNGLAVMLIPARTDTKWFHDYIYNKSNVQIRFLKGRLKFSGANNSAPFPSMIVIFNPLKKKDINVKEIVSLCDQAISIADNILNMKGVDDKNEKQD